MQIIRNKNASFIELKIGTEEEFSVRKHTHEEISIGIIKKGSADATVKGLHFSLTINDIILIPPDTVHLCVPDMSCDYYFKMLYVDANWIEEVFKINPYSMTPDVEKLSEHEKEKIDAFFKSFRNENDPLKIETDCIVLLDNLLNNVFSVTGKAELKKTDSGSLIKIKEYLDENYYSSISLDELSNISGLNKFHLLRMFRKKYKITPHAYITNLRFNRARKLLKSNKQIAEISIECGFFDQSHFVKIFKQYFGMNPNRYRK